MKAVYENHYLSDEDIANFARHSFADVAKNFAKKQNDNLVKFLARGMASGDWEGLLTEMRVGGTERDTHALADYIRKIPEHWVPFGHPQISLRVTAPVPIRTQCFKHKVGFVESEESRRYIRTEPEFYFPEYFRKAAANVKQGSDTVPHNRSAFWMDVYANQCELAKKNYMDAIEDGICPEQARFFLPQGTEVTWVWTGSLYAFANFYNQRADSHAQKEIQDLARDVSEIIRPLYPVAWAALTEGAY